MPEQPGQVIRSSQMTTGALHHPEFAKLVIFTDDIIEFIRHYLLNEVISSDGKTWAKRLDINGKALKPLMKEEYVYELTSHLRITITRFVAMTKMEKNEVNNMIEFTANDLDIWFALNWKKAGMSKEMYYSDLVSDSIINLIEAIMKMPQEGSIQDFFKTTYSGSESIGQPQQQQKNPIFPSFLKIVGGNK
jgi:hypothetical protein